MQARGIRIDAGGLVECRERPGRRPVRVDIALDREVHPLVDRGAGASVGRERQNVADDIGDQLGKDTSFESK